MTNIPLKGSERAAMRGARVLAPADPAERLEVTLLVRRRARQDFAARVAACASGLGPSPYLSRDEFAKRHGADAPDLAAVRAFAAAHGLAVEQEDAPRRTVVLSGSVAQFGAAFNVQLQQMSHAGRSYRGRTGAILLPANLDGIVEAVLGLDSRPQASPHCRIRRLAASGAVSYTPIQVATAYGFPNGTGQGQCVAIIELGGG
ncbi:MAG TPA: protease pro-enzyme activation domain-containing protein, partial [Steroidobacteraceae bacterium]